MHRNKETVCLLHNQFLLSARVHLPTRVYCKNPKVPIAKSLLQPILLPADQIIMVTTNFLLLLKIIILSSFINFSSTAFGKLHSYQLVILLLRFMDLIIIRSGAVHFFMKMIIWEKKFSCDPHNFDGDKNLVPEFDGLLQDPQKICGNISSRIWKPCWSSRPNQIPILLVLKSAQLNCFNCDLHNSYQ